jgi:hypothetical protein
MASQAEVQTMATDARCFNCVSEKQLLAMVVWQIWSQAHPTETMTLADVQTLADSSACLAQCGSHKTLLAMIVQLLYEAS